MIIYVYIYCWTLLCSIILFVLPCVNYCNFVISLVCSNVSLSTFFSCKILLVNIGLWHSTLTFKISLSIHTDILHWDFNWNYIEYIDPSGGELISSLLFMNVIYPSIYLGPHWFLPIMLCNFLCGGLVHLSLFNL